MALFISLTRNGHKLISWQGWQGFWRSTPGEIPLFETSVLLQEFRGDADMEVPTHWEKLDFCQLTGLIDAYHFAVGWMLAHVFCSWPTSPKNPTRGSFSHCQKGCDPLFLSPIFLHRSWRTTSSQRSIFGNLGCGLRTGILGGNSLCKGGKWWTKKPNSHRHGLK